MLILYNTSDSNEAVIINLTAKIFGKVFGDKGYLLNKKLFEKLYLKNIQFITNKEKYEKLFYEFI